MYNDFYSLSAEPFRLSPDPEFCYRHPSYAKARAYMQYALERGEGFVLVTGMPGTGKTTLIEDLLAGLEGAPVIVSHLTTTQLQGDDLLRMVCYEIGADAQGLDKATLLRRIQEVLLRQAGNRQRTLLLVDEAQDLSESALEELRLLTNLHVHRRPLLQIFLIGQDALRRMVAKPSMEQLKQRILAACHLEPLKLKETREYLRHRLKCAGWRGDPIISGDVVRLVQAASLGVPRRINIVADRLLLHGYVEGKHELGEADARVVVRELRQEQLFGAGAEEGAGQAAVSDVDTLSPLALLGEGGEADTNGRTTPPQAQAAAGAQAGRHGNGSGTGNNVARLAVREVPSPVAPPTVAPERREEPAELSPVAKSKGERSVATMPTKFAPPPVAEPPARRSEGAPQDVPAAAGVTVDLPVVAPRPRSRVWRYTAAGVLILLLIAFALALGRPELMDLAESRWETWKARLMDLQTSLAIPWDSRSGAPAAKPATDSAAITTPEPVLPTVADSGERPMTVSTIVESGVADAPVAEQQAEPSASVSGLEFSRSPEFSAPQPASMQQAPGASTLQRRPRPGTDVSPDSAVARPTITSGADVREPVGRTSMEPDGKGSPASPAVAAEVVAQFDGPRRQPAETDEVARPPAPGKPPSAPSEARSQVEPTVVAEVRPPQPAASPEQAGSTRVARAREAPRAAPSAENDGLQALHADLRRSGLPVQRLDDRTLKLSLRKEIPFRFDSAEVPEGSRPVLDKLAAIISRHRGWTVTVVGHTDSTGPDEYNLALSLERARSVAGYLIQQGLPAGRVTSEGKGESEPAVIASVAAGYRKWLDRRIEIIVRSSEPPA
ncbi:MAG: AAA family ATPase [Gammaproteobacteria bacterium]|nr:AAA family ATPase [Gammaproteobacteria bacterium]MDJ0872671.1 AAA family ATPase [Gammaproteobacteria bacterium]